MRTRIGSLGAALLFLSCFSFAFGAEGARFLPRVISVGGEGPVYIGTGAAQREINVGQEIQYGSVIKTGPKNTATLQYPDESLLSVDADSEVEIQERTGGSQKNKLNSGQIRASVVKLKSGQTLPSKPRFVVRTKAAVMGVRGTEFVIAVDPTGYTTQVHTLEGLVDVATDETNLMAGQGTPVESGNFIEATEKGMNPPKPFNREDFLNSMKPSVPGGPSEIVFSDPTGRSILKPDLIKLADPKTKEPEAPLFKKEEEEQKKTPEQRQLQEQKPDDTKKDEESVRRVRLLSFQLGFFYTSAFSDPAFVELKLPDPIRALSFSWNPSIPVPLTGFLTLRGHLGIHFARDGSLNNQFLVREGQLFLNATVFGKFFGELGMGGQSWLHTGWHTPENTDGPTPAGPPKMKFGPLDEGLFTVNVGMFLRDRPRGFMMDRIYIGRSLLLTSPRAEEFRAGVGFSL